MKDAYELATWTCLEIELYGFPLTTFAFFFLTMPNSMCIIAYIFKFSFVNFLTAGGISKRIQNEHRINSVIECDRQCLS